MNKVVTQDEWLKARQQLLKKEKESLQQLDDVSRRRRELPWLKIEKQYTFNTIEGSKSLVDLFGTNSQLMIYHFMFAPGWQEGCPGCSFLSDHLDGAAQHLIHHDVSLVVVSRAPLAEFQEFKQRMDWEFEWVSSSENEFNFDYRVSFTPEVIASGQAHYNYEQTEKVGEEMPGLSVFCKNDAGEVFHTYSTYARGLDLLIGAHNLLDLTPKGRNEKSTMDWVRHHDRYDTSGDGNLPTVNLDTNRNE